ncbi:MAG TPA: lipid-A-disaccharide synthase [Gemmatimonadales bacterium]|jgi:lipid-A-disaccharide synthase
MRLLVAAGEPSGDLHGARVVAELRRRFPTAEIEAIGGPKMAAAGASLRGSIEQLSAIGLVEIIAKIPAHWRIERTLVRDFRAHRYDLVVLIDYPGFHAHVARRARAFGIPVLWYIAPQYWGWWPARARRFRGLVDHLAVILPFEAEFFRRAGVPDTTFVGHPLLDAEAPPTREEARAALGVPTEARVLAVFPGSRRGEVAALWPRMRAAAQRLLDEGACDAVMVAATAWGAYPDADRLQVVRDDPARVLAAADAVIAKSGTTTLQAAIAGVPMVVAYMINALTARLVRPMVTSRWFALPNLVAEREIVPELLQGQLTVDALVAAVRPLLDHQSAAAVAQRAGLLEVCRRLGGPGASARVAALAGEILTA